MKGIHHVAYTCRDIEETYQFYHDLLGLPLVNTELQENADGSWFKHIFFQLDDGGCIAFFKVQGFGEPDPIRTAVSTDLGLPVWVNHIAFRVDADKAKALSERIKAAGVTKTMDVDHGWCHSRYYTDPNGILVEICVDTSGMQIDESEALERMRKSSTSSPI
jgi:catechol 2,3-dioxygenase-like lactoylglutathione lyase family enzyme